MVAELPPAVSELAESQEGVITRAQAAGLGLTESALRARVRAGYWLPLGRGVYRTFTGEPHRRSVLWAAVLQAGYGAVLSHQSAAEETVLDLAHSAATLHEAASWLCRAIGGRFTTAERLGAAIAARGRLRRRAGLLAALEEIGDGAHSLLELRYVKIERAHGLPVAKRQARLRGSST